MSALPPIFPTGLEAKALNDMEIAVRTGAVRALRTRAAIQRRLAAEGTSAAGEKFPGITIQTGEAAIASRLAAAFERVADEIESEAVQ